MRSGGLNLLFSNFQSLAVANPDADADEQESQFSSLATACLECPSEALKVNFCQDLSRKGARWDFEEANALYKTLSALRGPEDVTVEVVQQAKTYLDHVRQRLRSVKDHQPAFLDEAQRFLDWHAQLSRVYSLDGIQIKIASQAPFVRFDSIPYTYKDGWSTATRYREEAVTPSGSVTLYVGGRLLSENTYSGYTATLPITDIRWGIGEKVEFKITNDTSGQSVSLADSSRYALLRVARNGLRNDTVTMTFWNLRVPAIKPDPKRLVPPDPPS
jgi:hypothetical protein